MSLRVVFMGTPEFATPVLGEILGQGHEVAAVFTRAPAPAKRGMDLTPSPVQRMAEGFGIPVFTPRSFRDAGVSEELASIGADVAVVVAYGLILPFAALQAPREGCLNLHASLLPRWRGAAPIQRAIMAGDRETGVMVMRMEEGLDTGPVAMAEKIPISPDMTAGELQERASRLGADLMARALAALSRGSLGFVPQAQEGVTYARKIDKAEARIDWSRPAREVLRHIHGLSPFPGAWCEIASDGEPARIKILRCEPADGSGAPGEVLDDGLTIACGDGAIRILELQRAGKAPMKAADFLRGTPLKPPARLG
jgi:methionyl-tRNA formyltransferase